MSKKKWLLLIIVLFGVGYLIISKVNPAMGASIDQAVGPTLSGFASWIYVTVNQSPIWQKWDIWISGAFFSLVTAIIMWKGHGAYNRIRGSMVKSAAKEAYGWQTAPPITQPVPIATAKPKEEPTPVPAAPPTVEVETKEETA